MQGAFRGSLACHACTQQRRASAQQAPGLGFARTAHAAVGGLPASPAAGLRAALRPGFGRGWALRQPAQRGAGARRRGVVTSARYNSAPAVTDRILSSLPYLVPLFDGLRYGKFLFLQFPFFGRLLAPLDPLIRLYFSFPFASLVVFFAVYAGLVNNQRFSRFVRYNAMQSILLDIVLVLPGLLESVFRPPMGGPGLQIYINAYNSVWLFVFVCVAYAVGSCLTGNTARLPLIADAADQQVR